MVILILGAQGTGKGTIAGLICQSTGLVQLSTGDIFRKNISENTKLGMEASKYMEKGLLVPDEITIPMVAEYLDLYKDKKGVILDGFPRSIEQAKKLDELLEERNSKVDFVINLTTPREEIIDRIITRRVCSNPKCKETYNIKMKPPIKEGVCDKCGAKLIQRDDDSREDAINKRLEVYDTKTAPLVDYYNNKGILRTEEVSARINRLGKEVASDLIEYINNL